MELFSAVELLVSNLQYFLLCVLLVPLAGSIALQLLQAALQQKSIDANWVSHSRGGRRNARAARFTSQ